MARKHNTPKKYPNPGTGKGKNPRVLCEKCGLKNMVKLRCESMIEGKKTVLKPALICKCGHVKIIQEELNKIPD